ncbi:E3 ubiquitin-protein ligase RSL1-like [Corylus avellana]|uniref:E3 ubiquitin-protein ligase RSL1-like n=1 Tax=Corylus avellana TaxID=13451 RepID=UPI00286A54E3|nr:E3 ubiquitin-protein ligase RSL1-like [Corylus avellana]
MAQESTSDLMFVDDFYFSLLFDEEEEEEEIFFDDFYTTLYEFAEYHKEEAMKESASDHRMFADDFCFSTKEAGESSQYYGFFVCDICMERKDGHQMFINETCLHTFCSDCIGKHVATKIQDGITHVSCPGWLECQGVLRVNACRPMLPKDVMERWDEELCRALFASEMVFYCPFKDCSAMLVDDNIGEGEVMITESECPFCHRLFCAQCQVPWHPGVECQEFQILNESERGREDLMLRELAHQKKWKRCPNCKYFVERTAGCLHMTCRCKFQFCYGCGGSWTGNHGDHCVRD